MHARTCTQAGKRRGSTAAKLAVFGRRCAAALKDFQRSLRAKGETGPSVQSVLAVASEVRDQMGLLDLGDDGAVKPGDVDMLRDLQLALDYFEQPFNRRDVNGSKRPAGDPQRPKLNQTNQPTIQPANPSLSPSLSVKLNEIGLHRWCECGEQ